MKKTILLSLILLAVVAFAASAAASFVNGTDLSVWNAEFKLYISGQDYDVTTVWKFYEYISGVVDANLDLGSKWFDLPATITLRQIAIVVSNYLDNHPEKISAGGAYIVVEALSRTFPK